MQEALTPTVFTRHNHQFRALLIDDQAWFVTADLAALLGYRHSTGRITQHLAEDQQRREGLITPAGVQWHDLLDESGLYAALMRDGRPENESLRIWVSQRVIPELRNNARIDSCTPKLGTMLWKASDIQVIQWQGKLWVALEDMPRLIRR